MAASAIAPPIEPMLAKLADELPDRRRVPVRAEVGRVSRDRLSRRRRRLHPEPRPAAARSLLSRAARRRCSAACRTAACSTARSSSRRRAGSTSTRCSCGCIRPRRASPSSRRRRRRRSSRSTCWRVDGRDLRDVAAERAARAARAGCSRTSKPPIHLTPMTRDPAVAAEWLSRFEGAGLDGVDRQAGAAGPTSPASAR